MKYSIFIVLLSFHFSLPAQTLIQGKINTSHNDSIVAYHYDNFITKDIQYLDTEFNQSDHFTIKINDITTFLQVFINVENTTFQLFVENNKTYDIEINGAAIYFKNATTNAFIQQYTTQINQLKTTFLNPDQASKGLTLLAKYHEEISSIEDKLALSLIQWQIYHTKILLLNELKDKEKVKNLKSSLKEAFLHYDLSAVHHPYFTATLELFMQLQTYHPLWETGRKNQIQLRKVNYQIQQFKKTSIDEIAILLGWKYIYEEHFYLNKVGFNKWILDKIETLKDQNSKSIGLKLYQQFNKYATGKDFPKIHLMNILDSQMVNLSSIESEYILVDFWATWCRPCVQEMKHFNEIREKYSDQLTIVSISIDKNMARVQRFKAKNNYDWTFLYLGEKTALQKELHIRLIPAYYLIDKNGKIVETPIYDLKKTLAKHLN